MRIRALLALAVPILLVLATVSPSQAQDTFARHYVVTPRDGMVAQFEAALKSHVQWRIANNDPWTWGVSTVEVGDNLGDYWISSFNHAWADFDAYDSGFGPQGLVHWNATVAPLVESASSSISTTNQTLSNMAPEGTPLAFVTISVFHIRPGREAQFNQAVATANEVLRQHEYGAHYVWSTPVIGGGPGPRMSLVALHQNWADMAEPDPSFEDIMMQAMGEDGMQEWMEDIGQTYRGVESYTLRLRPDLGVNQN